MTSVGELAEQVLQIYSDRHLLTQRQHVLGSQVVDYWFDPSKFIVVRENSSPTSKYEDSQIAGALCEW